MGEDKVDAYWWTSEPKEVEFKVFKWGKECATLTGVDGDELKQKLRDLCTKHSPQLDSDGKPTTLNPAAESAKDK